jgi:hypothetical protein
VVKPGSVRDDELDLDRFNGAPVRPARLAGSASTRDGARWQVREHLPAVDDDAIFEMSLSFMLAGLYARAPRRCACPRHAGEG